MFLLCKEMERVIPVPASLFSLPDCVIVTVMNCERDRKGGLIHREGTQNGDDNRQLYITFSLIYWIIRK